MNRLPQKLMTICLAVMLFLSFQSPSIAVEEEHQKKKNDTRPWYMTMYVGQLTENDLWEVLAFQSDFVSSYMLTLAIGKEFWRYDDYFSLELEGQVAKYINDYTFKCDSEECMGLSPEHRAEKTQDHWEFNAALVLRWLKFPWDRYVETSFAVGEGISVASRVPAVEENLHYETFGQVEGLETEYKTSTILNYLMFELALALPEYPQWNLITRIHHRSSVFGLFADSDSGSNTIALGLRYEFR